MIGEEVGPRQRAAETKKRRTRERLINATIDLYGQSEEREGDEFPTLEEVADEAGVSLPTLYNHFANRFELYHAAANQLFEPIVHPIKTAIDAGAYAPVDFRSEVVSYVARSAKLLLAHQQLLRAYIQAYFESRQYDRPTPLPSFMSEGLVAIMKAADKGGEPVRFQWGSVDYYVSAFLLKMCEYYSYMGWFRTDARSAASEMLQHMLPVVDRVNGLGNFKAVEDQLDKIIPKDSDS